MDLGHSRSCYSANDQPSSRAVFKNIRRLANGCVKVDYHVGIEYSAPGGSRRSAQDDARCREIVSAGGSTGPTVKARLVRKSTGRECSTVRKARSL